MSKTRGVGGGDAGGDLDDGGAEAEPQRQRTLGLQMKGQTECRLKRLAFQFGFSRLASPSPPSPRRRLGGHWAMNRLGATTCPKSRRLGSAYSLGGARQRLLEH